MRAEHSAFKRKVARSRTVDPHDDDVRHADVEHELVARLAGAFLDGEEERQIENLKAVWLSRQFPAAHPARKHFTIMTDRTFMFFCGD